MDYVPSPESFYAPEFGKSTFAASPNSLYMYDLERHDMQTTLNSGVLGQSCPGPDIVALSTEPEFDLNPQFENSNSLEGFFGRALIGNTVSHGTETSVKSQGGISSEKQGSCGMFEMLGLGRQELKQDGPTLAELNMDPYLFDDIDSIIGADGKTETQTTVNHLANDTTGQVVTSKPLKTETSLRGFNNSQLQVEMPTQTRQSQCQPSVLPLTSVSNLFGSRATQNVAVVPSPSVTATTIKTEPVDMCDNKSCLQQMLSSTPLKPALGTPFSAHVPTPPEHQVMPVTSQSHAPTLAQNPVKSESVEEKWKEIEKFIHDPEPSTSRKRKRNASGGSAIMSDEEDFKSSSIDLEIFTDDSDSDADSDISDTPFEESLTELAKKSKQYFWQYNVQAKGPKGTRLKLHINDVDPHHPSNFEDPVFDVNSTSLVGIRHGGKARKGDGNEVSPNPKKLCQIGQQLFKLNRQINNCQVSNDLPANIRNKSRKEKNKLASRACRLKKKAQHEANKVKLTGLDCEHGELLDIIHLIWPQLKERAQQQMKDVPLSSYSESLCDRLDIIIKSQHKTAIAGNTTDYVNKVIAKVEEGDPTGGLPIKTKIKK